MTATQRAVNAVGDGVAWVLSAQWRWVLVLVLVVGTAAYCSGRSSGSRAAKLEQVEREEKANAALISAAAARRAITRREAAVAVREGQVARTTYATARARVQVVDDSHVSIDNAPPTFVGIPTVSVLRSGDDLARKDNLSIAKLEADVEACGNQNALYLDRIKLLEKENALVRPSRCGWKCGAGAATALLLSVLFLLR